MEKPNWPRGYQRYNAFVYKEYLCVEEEYTKLDILSSLLQSVEKELPGYAVYPFPSRGIAVRILRKLPEDIEKRGEF